MNLKSLISNAPANRSPIPSCSTAATFSTVRKWNGSAGSTKAWGGERRGGGLEHWSIGAMEPNKKTTRPHSLAAPKPGEGGITPTLQTIDVSAALIFHDGKLLITQRHFDAHQIGRASCR